MKKNLLLTFMFSFIPGAGQMYQEYMKRGLSIMVLFGGFLAIASITGMAIFIIPMLIICAYSFFDTYNIRNLSDEKKEIYKDDYIWNSTDLRMSVNKSKTLNNRKIIGFILIGIGIYIMIDTVIFGLASNLGIDWLTQICSILSRYIPTIFTSIIAVILGFKLIYIGKKED